MEYYGHIAKQKILSPVWRENFHLCTIIPIPPFINMMCSDTRISGTPETIRTSDPSLRRRMLYPLSYWGL